MNSLDALTLARQLAGHQLHSHGDRPYRMSAALRLVLMGLEQALQEGTLFVVLPNGSLRMLSGKKSQDPAAICVIHDDRFTGRFLTRGILGFCEAYLDADWSSPDITGLFTMMLQNEHAIQDLILGKDWYRRLEGLMHFLRRNHRQNSRKNIAYHYDLGNDFYQSWLDESMTYSSALFEGDRDLTTAQQEKYRQLAKLLGLKPGQRVLEIGCGWGGFAEFAAKECQCHVTGITISEAQYEYALKRITSAGLQNQVDLLLMDYRDVPHKLATEFDAVVSIEMFEAVGEQYWPIYFETIGQALRPGGRAALQIITIAEKYWQPYRQGQDYIQKYIFPGGMLPTLSILQERVAAAGLVWQANQAYGADYARTLAAWQQRFQAAWPNLQYKFDERFKRMWEQYLHYCAAGFLSGATNVHQILLTKE